MNGLKFLVFAIAFVFCSAINAQKAVLPALKDNQSARIIITDEISLLAGAVKANPTNDLNDRMDLYKLFLKFLDEPTQIKPTTEYALTSAFLNNEVDKTGVPDQIAFNRFYAKVWNQHFKDLVNLVKL